MKKLDPKTINKLIVHHSDSEHKEGEDVVATIRQWHLDRGFSDIGYHFVITKDGKIHNGREPIYQGAHTKGANATSLGVCLIGKSDYTFDQFVALGRILSKLEMLFQRKIKVQPHRFFGKTVCPGFELNWDK